MGETVDTSQFMIVDDQGNTVKWDGIRDLEFETVVNDDAPYHSLLMVPNDDSLEVNLVCNLKVMRCRNKKRFKKLLMSIGVERDLTEMYIWLVQAANMSYQDAWLKIWLWYKFGNN